MKRGTSNPTYTFKSAVHWQMRAEKMRAITEEAHDATVRAMMLRIATDYERLSRLADDQVFQNSMMFRTAGIGD
jgi:hypothetical protein